MHGAAQHTYNAAMHDGHALVVMRRCDQHCLRLCRGCDSDGSLARSDAIHKELAQRHATLLDEWSPDKKGELMLQELCALRPACHLST